MPHGAPDWNIYRPTHRSYSVADLAEHAARVGSINTYDRRGDAYVLTDFSAGWGAWEHGGSGALAAQALVPYPHVHGGYSVRLTAGSTFDHNSFIELIPPVLSSQSFGVCVQFSCFDVYETFEVRLIADNGARRYDARVRHVFATNRLEVFLAVATWHTIPVQIVVQSDERRFYYLKFVIDLQNLRYDHLLFNDHAFDLKLHPLLDYGVGNTMGTEVHIQNTGRPLFNDIVNVDNVILTQDEL